MPERCPWCGDDPLYVAYHDAEWGVPERDGRALWEALMLEGFQAGLSWITILRKRDGFRAAFSGFQPEAVAAFGPDDIARLLADSGIVRHRGKIEATIGNARAFLALGGAQPFSDMVWSHVGGRPVQTGLAQMGQAQASTGQAVALSRRLKAAGFRFCGPTTVYAFMQAKGLVNDHLTSCHRHAALAG